MKHNLKKIGSAIAVVAALFLSASCTDDWNEHYDASTVDSGTLWQAISSQSNLSNFTRVAKACGYDLVLNGSQTFSVFAPTDDVFSSAEADSLIQEFQRQKAAGVRSDDNTVVRQFLQNHIALYKHPVSSLTNDSITMMNSKYAVLTSTKLSNSGLLTTNALFNNGVLFTVDKKLDYFPNVFEYLGHDSDLDSVYNFFNRYSIYEFNDAKSVPGENVDGPTVYLDSVSDLRNALFDAYGLINSEDSTYWLVAPTNSEWNRLLAEYEKYFNYDNTVAKRDSLIYTRARMAIMGGTFFSRTINPEPAFRDSAVSTSAMSYANRRMLGIEDNYYTYYKPFAAGGIFDGTQDIVCSNGHVRKASKFNISKFDTFMQNIKVEAENIQSQDTVTNSVDPLVVREVTSDNPFYNKVSGNSYVEIVPDPATANPTIRYRVPNVLSNVEYDIYGVFIPATAYDTLAVEEASKPSVFRVTLNWNDQNGKEGRKIFSTDIMSNPAVVDTVLLVDRFSFPTCSEGLSDPQVKVTLRANVKAKDTSIYSRTMRLDCLILKPREAEATDESSKSNSNI